MLLVEERLMADIAMCNNPNCRICESCFRHKATPSEYQCYFMVTKSIETEADCDEYWAIKDDKELRRLDKVWQD